MRKTLGFSILELMVTMAIVSILAATGFSQYQTYIIRSQATRVYTELNAYRTAAENCILENRLLNTDCGIEFVASNLTSSVTADLSSTSDTLKATFGGNAASALNGLSLSLHRTTSGEWTCTTTMEEKYRPKSC
ncbi:pilin [Granulosicoccaceae sp. 1_MG-2023]|nr:pilin [Granulosicoccaceae sp. 1_MG-2023]